MPPNQREAKIPNTIDRAFRGCSGLESVIWNAENCTKAGSSDHPIFAGCTKLSSVTFGENVKTIPAYAFRGRSGLTEITVDTNNSIYHSAGNCVIETKSKTLIVGCKTSKIPNDDSVTSIGASAFYGCSGLTSITIPNSVTSIGEWAFNGCRGLKEIRYNGKIADWKQIKQGSYWVDTGDYTVKCMDGKITKDGKETTY